MSQLVYIVDAVSSDVKHSVTDWFFSDEIQDKLVGVSDASNSRRVLHYGYKYDYITKSIYEEADPMPQTIKQLLSYIPNDGLDEDSGTYYNQCIINRYLPGQGIRAHIDFKKYGDSIACFTFGHSGREMVFIKPGDRKLKLYTKPGSLYIMQGDSRYRWKHKMNSRISDILDERKLMRKVIFSVTFRHVPPKLPASNIVI